MFSFRSIEAAVRVCVAASLPTLTFYSVAGEKTELPTLVEAQPSKARLEIDPAEKLQQALAEPRASKARLDMVLLPEVLRRLDASNEQIETIRKALKDMDRDLTRKAREIWQEAYESDNAGPIYAVEKVPELCPIVNNASVRSCKTIAPLFGGRRECPASLPHVKP
jgi:hypothetical protein